jgi:Xaa-Pro aminopeptidase
MTGASQNREIRRVGALGIATRDYRHRLLRELMDREKLDALAFMSGALIKFASNWSLDVSSFERPSLFVFPREGQPFGILHELSTNSWRFAVDAAGVWVPNVFFYSEHPRLRNRLPLSLQWNAMVASHLEQAGLQHARIGVDGEELARVGGVTLGLPYVQQLLPRLQLQNVAAQCADLFTVKHEEEIALIREAASLANWGQARWHEQVRPGLLTAEVDAKVAGLIVEEAARRYPPGVELAVFCQTISSPRTWFGTAPSDTVEKGSALVTSISTQINALGATNERTRFYGKPSPRQAKLFESSRAANEAACAAAVVGRSAAQVSAAARAVIDRAGLAQFSLDWAAPNDGPLRARQLLTVSPGIYEWGTGGCRHGNVVIVGPKPEILTPTPMDLASQTLT